MDITKENFEAEVLKSAVPVVVDFWAEWCGPCKMLAPVVEKVVAAKAGAVKLCKVNVDTAGDLAAQFGIMSIPTLILFKDGKAVRTSVGYIGESDVEDFIKS